MTDGKKKMLLGREIDKLKKDVIGLSVVVEDSVTKAVVAVDKRDADLANEVISADADIDRAEVDLEEECLKILALHQPVAKDLRFIVAILKINNDLERIGDLAVNVAQRALYLADHKRVETPPILERMADMTRTMLRKSLEALIGADGTLAREVLTLDDEVDSWHRDMFKLIQDRIKEQPEGVAGHLQVLSVSRHLERIADLATNIAEDVIYLIEGEIVRHQHVEPRT